MKDNYNYENTDLSGSYNNSDNAYQGDFGSDDGYNVVYEKPSEKRLKNTIIGILLLVVIIIIIILLIRGCSGSNNVKKIGVNVDAPLALYMGEDADVKITASGGNNLGNVNYDLNVADSKILQLEDAHLAGEVVRTRLIPQAPGKTTLNVNPSLDDKKLDSVEKEVVVCKAFNAAALKSNKKIKIKKGETYILTFDLGNDSVCYSSLEFKPSNSNVISVDNNMTISGDAKGTSKLTVSNGKNKVDIDVEVVTVGKTTPQVASSPSAPKVTSVTMRSNNKTSSAYAKKGDTITLTSKFNQTLSGKPIIIIGGEPASVPSGTSTFVSSVKVDDSFGNGRVKFTISNFKNSKGAYGAPVSSVTSGSSVIVDNVKPTCRLTKDKNKLKLTTSDNYAVSGVAINQIPTSANSYASGNKKTATATSAGSWYGHVKDKAGNIGHCSVSVSSSDIGGGSTTTPGGSQGGSGNNEEPPKEEKKEVKSIDVNPSSISLSVGGSKQITATVSPADAADKTLTWSSSNVSIATVSSSGVITAKAAGTAVITASSRNGIKAKITVTVAGVPSCTVTAKRADNTNFSAGTWTHYSIKLTLSCSADTNLSSVTYTYGTNSGNASISGKNASANVTLDTSSNTVLTSSFKYTAKDVNGGTTSGSFAYKIDKVKPYFSINSAYVTSGTYAGGTKVTLYCQDTHSGVSETDSTGKNMSYAELDYGTGKSAANKDTVSFNFKNSTSLSVKVTCKDVAGNETNSTCTVKKKASGTQPSYGYSPNYPGTKTSLIICN